MALPELPLGKMQREMDELKEQLADLKTGGGGGGSNGNMESRVSKLESDVGHIQSDIKEIKDDLRTLLKGGIAAFLITWAGIIASALGLAYLMAKGFKWL
jgi:hypothetical protein